MTRSPLAPAFLAALALALAGCSPHPGAGNWTADGDAEFPRLEVHFKGWADLYRPGQDESAYHCFWSADGERTIALSCTPAENPDAKAHFQLEVAEGGRARLTRNGERVGRYHRQAQ